MNKQRGDVNRRKGGGRMASERSSTEEDRRRDKLQKITNIVKSSSKNYNNLGQETSETKKMTNLAVTETHELESKKGNIEDIELVQQK